MERDYVFKEHIQFKKKSHRAMVELLCYRYLIMPRHVDVLPTNSSRKLSNRTIEKEERRKKRAKGRKEAGRRKKGRKEWRREAEEESMQIAISRKT